MTDEQATRPHLTGRGFECIDFRDRYNFACSLQKRSLAGEDCIWFGQDNCKCGEPSRAHLTQEQVRALLPFLQRFAETGDLFTVEQRWELHNREMQE